MPWSGGGNGGGGETPSQLAVQRYLAAMSDNRQEIKVVVDGPGVFLDVTALNGGNMVYFLDNEIVELNCTTGQGVNGAARVELTQGTQNQAIFNIVYVAYDLQNGSINLLSSTVAPSVGHYAPVALVSIQDANTVAIEGPVVLQRTTEAIEHNGKSAISWEREKIRAGFPIFWSGVEPNVTVVSNASSEDDINFETTNGQVFQLHRQRFPAYNVSDQSHGAWIANASGNGALQKLERIFNFNKIKETSDGTPLSDGESLVLVVFGLINNKETTSRILINLPSGKYSNDLDAVLDTNNTADFRIPASMRTVGFLLAKIVLKYSTANGGTWTNLTATGVISWSSRVEDVSSPNYPGDYPNNSNVTKIIQEPGALAIRVVFDDFDTEAGFDYVRLRDAGNNLVQSLDGALGSFTSFQAIGDTMNVIFTSDSSVRRRGFHIGSVEYATPASPGSGYVDLRGDTPHLNMNI